MTSLVYYLLQVIVSSGLLFGYYQLLLRNKRFHQYNRFYLLGTVVLSILIPFLHIPVYFTHEETASSVVVRTLTILSSSYEGVPGNAGYNQAATQSSIYNIDLAWCFYALIAGIALARIIYGLLRIKRLGKNNPVKKLDNIRFVNTNDNHAPFSFFNWLFWHRDIELKSEKGEQIFRHELFHIRQKHSLDIVFLELVSMVFWINPFIHLIKKEIRAIHEFLADQYALDKGSQWNYAETLLMHALQTKHSLVNPFFHNQIKRRIAMITNPQKTSHQYLRKVLVLPVAVVVITLFAFSYRKDKPLLSATAANPVTVIIDAGHGGTDPGAISPDNRIKESELTLTLAKTIQRLSSEYNVNVVMTRENDALPGGATNKEDGLRKRVEITNKINPRLFISLHVNAGKNEFQQTYSGIEAYVTNRRQDDQGKAAASTLLHELSTVYKTAQDLKFREEKSIFVLDKNKCATVLLQCGYINNRMDLEFFTREENQEKLARSILKGIVEFDKKIAFHSSPFIQERDSIPDTSFQASMADKKSSEDILINGLDIRLKDLSLTADSIVFHMPGHPSNKADNFELVVFNHELLTLTEAKKRFSGIRIKYAFVTVIDRDNKEAIEKYGDRAKNGALVITDAIVVKKTDKDKTEIKPQPVKNLFKELDPNPLYVIDGKIMPRSKGKMSALDSLTPNTIETINILKGQSAIDKYQEQGSNGVIEIILKKNPGAPANRSLKDSITADLTVKNIPRYSRLKFV